jgi:hypothetical protein
MGRRSRKRLAAPGPRAGVSSRADERALHDRRPAAGGRSARRRSGLTSPEDRPPPPWGSFPLVELVVLVALIMLVAGFVTRRGPLLIGGLAVGSLAGLELAIREHFTGFRSHSSLLALLPTGIALAATFFATHGGARALSLPIAAAVFLATFRVLRQLFKRRTGGAGFRR